MQRSLDHHHSCSAFTRSASKKNFHGEGWKFEGKYVEHSATSTILLGRNFSSRWFYGTSLAQKHLLGSYNNSSSFRQKHKVSEQTMGHKVDNAGCVGCKVLPDTMSASSSCRDSSSDGSEKDYPSSDPKSDRRTAMLRMKELLAAAAKTPKRASMKGWKALRVRMKATPRSEVDDSSSTSSSSKLSFSWGVESCTKNSYLVSNNLFRISAASQPSTELGTNVLASPETSSCVRHGHWITTDDDYLVLEL